jgi:hypothetical protein
VSRADEPLAVTEIDPGMPGRTTSEKVTVQAILLVTVAGVPTGTAKAPVPIVITSEPHRRPSVASD